jgi:hypothetical protein
LYRSATIPLTLQLDFMKYPGYLAKRSQPSEAVNILDTNMALILPHIERCHSLCIRTDDPDCLVHLRTLLQPITPNLLRAFAVTYHRRPTIRSGQLRDEDMRLVVGKPWFRTLPAVESLRS